MSNAIRARVSMLIHAPAADVYHAFVEPERLTRFWLSSASAPLEEGRPVRWAFMVEGAAAETTATRLEPDRRIDWAWSDGSTVGIELESLDGGTAVTIVNEGFSGDADEQVAAALNSTEGFAIVLSDLKTLLEQGRSAGLTRAKARLIEARKG